jgi:hypothetical protein
MSKKRKILLYCTIVLIVGCYLIAFFAIENHSDEPEKVEVNKPVETSYSDLNEITDKVEESAYKGNQLENGTSPLNGCFGEGKYGGHAWINFDNSNASDAIVCLVSISTGKTIRNEYIKAGTDFKMTRIPSGTYYLKVYYGNDWNPTKTNFCGTDGAFDSDEHFSKSENESDLIVVKNTSESYTTGRITLYNVPNGNMSTESMSASEFFSN